MAKHEKNIYLRKDGRWKSRHPKGKTVSCAGTFGRFSDEWLRAQTPELKASSVAKYSNIMNSYLLPEFGARDICSISRTDVILFSRNLLTAGGVSAKGLSPKTVNSTLSVMKNIFEYVRREKELQVTGISDISVRQPQKPMRILSRPEQQRLSRFLCADPFPCNLGILLCLYTGLRIGEVCALKWEDICISEQYLYVHRTMQRIQMPGIPGRKTRVVVQSPKSGCSIRKVPVPDEILQLLIPAQKSKDAFLLTGLSRSFVEPRSMENHFKSVAKDCEIADINFHALRHTFATRCIELGFDIKSLSEILGHASVSITLNRYVHPSMELKQKNMNMLSSLLTTD